VEVLQPAETTGLVPTVEHVVLREVEVTVLVTVSVINELPPPPTVRTIVPNSVCVGTGFGQVAIWNYLWIWGSPKMRTRLG
jgi:hypothetical protein